MKNFKNILFILLGVISIGFITTSCNDEFSEKDLLELQVQLGSSEDSLNAVRQLAALNAAGELVSFQVKTVDTDGVGVAGVDVTLGAASSDGTADNQTLTSDANGSVYFNRVAIGGNNLNLAGASIMDALLTLDFGSISEGTHYEIINGNVIPMPVTENAVITVLGATTTTATVSGVASIETDLTNTTKEIPQNVTVVADFDDNLVINSSIGINYFFATNNNALNLGSAAVDNATGAYTMTVPAGVTFDLIVPELQATQRIAVNGFDNQDLPRPEYRDVLTNFGPSWGTDFIPSVPGAFAIFEQPAAGGEGFSLGSFAQEGRAIQNFTIDSGDPWTEPYEPVADIILQMTNLGAGYQSSPAVAITDASGTLATAEAYIEYLVSSVTVTTPATGYAFDAPVTVVIRYFDNQTVPVSQFGVNLAVTTSATGTITQTEIDAGIVAANSNDDNGFGTNYAQNNEVSTSMEVVFPAGGAGDGVGTVSINGRLQTLDMTNTGSGYVSPSFVFTGGGGTTQAAMSVLEFGTQWSFNVDNAGVTTPYVFLPNSITFEYNQITTGSAAVASSTNGQNIEFGGSSTLLSLLTVDGSGNIQFVDQTATYRTTFNSSAAPRVLVDETESIPAARYIRPYEINAAGQITGMSTNGYNISFTSSDGDGYSSQFTVTVEASATGAPGSGASILITGGTNQANGEYQWAGSYNVLNGGSGYLQDLNLHNPGIDADNRVNYNNGGDVTNVTLRAGATHLVDITYGTGNKTVDVY